MGTMRLWSRSKNLQETPEAQKGLASRLLAESVEIVAQRSGDRERADWGRQAAEEARRRLW